MHKCFWSKWICLSISLFLPSSLIKDDWKQDLRLCKNPYAPDATSLTLFRVDIIIVSIATTCNGTVDYDFRKRINNSRQNPKGIIWFSCTIKDSVSKGIRRKSNRKYSMDAELLWKQVSFLFWQDMKFLISFPEVFVEYWWSQMNHWEQPMRHGMRWDLLG